MCRKWTYPRCILIPLCLFLMSITTVADASLVGWWKFDEPSGTIAHDSSGYGNHGNLHGGLQLAGGGLEFDGVDDYVDCGDGPSLNITGEVTVTAWIRLDEPVVDRKIAGNQDGITGGYKFGVYSDLLEFEIRTANNVAVLNRNAVGGMFLEPGIYHHVAGVYSQGNYIRTYVNGVLDRELSTTAVLGTSTGTFKIGREPFSDLYFWFGFMEDVRVYNRALTQQEILNIVEGNDEPTPSHLYPANGAILFPEPDPQVILTWPAGVGAVSYDVYFGMDPAEVAEAVPMTPSVYLGRTEVNSHELFALEPGGTYYWRIDEIDAGGTIIKGNVWNFKIPRDIEPDEELIRNYTPAGWQAEDVQWIRDVDPHNKIDDTIDRSDATSFDVVVNYKRAVRDDDIDFLNGVGAQSEVQMRLKYLSSVAVGGLTKDDLFAIADNPDVAFIEQQFGFGTTLNVSVPNICVTPAAGGCTTTVPSKYNGSGINIVIMGSGVDNGAHDALPSSRFVAGYDATTKKFVDPDDTDGHETHVASVALGSATANTSRGVAPGAGLIDVKKPSACGTGWLTNTLDALQVVYDNRKKWGVHIINMSFGQCDNNGDPVQTEGLDHFSQLVDLAQSMGIVVVASAGNEGPNNTVLATPAGATRAITVAASNHMNTVTRADDVIARFSSRGPRDSDGDADQIDELKPEVTAPGNSLPFDDDIYDNDAVDADTFAAILTTANVAAGTGVTINVTSSADIAAGELIGLYNPSTSPPTLIEEVTVATSAGMGGTSFTTTTTSNHPAGTIVWEREPRGIFAAEHNTKNDGIRMNGTSMAAPHVAGLAALIMQARSGINAASVKDLIVSTAELPTGTTASALGWNNAWGWGLVNASAAINAATNATTKTDLTFPNHPPSPGWLSPDISHTALQVGKAATVTVKIRNKGPNPANNVRIHFGVHVFTASTPTFYDIGTKIVNIPVDKTGHTPVSMVWTPQDPDHQCLKVEIGYGPDADHSNNKAQRNVKVAKSPVQFRVRNTLTEEPAQVDLVAKLENPDTGWTYRIDPPFVMLAASDPPAEIEVELYPPANAPPGAEQILHVAAVMDTNSGAVTLGGISVRHIVSDGLVAHYAFENDTIDISGNGFDGIVIGDPIFVDGVKGMALDFYGDNYVDCGGNEEFSFTDEMTVSTWVNIRSVTHAWMAMIAKGENAWRLGINNGTTGIHYAFSGGDRDWQQANTAIELNIGEWYHVAATYDTNMGALVYINGVLDAYNENVDGIDTNDMPLLLGENPEATGRFFDGMLDEIKIYNRALSTEEISNLADLR